MASLAITQIVFGGCLCPGGWCASEKHKVLIDVVADFGAVCDDQTDDYRAIQNALDSAGRVGGGVVVLPMKTCRTSKTLHFNYSNITLSGEGKIDFVPTPPFLPHINDRALEVGDLTSYGTNLPIIGAIKAGDTSFTAQNAADAATLSKGDWVVINEIDQGAGSNIVAIEWAQVDSVSATMATLNAPLRVNFPNLRPFIAPHASGLGFFKVKRLIENSVISDIQVQVPLTAEPVAGVTVRVARNTTVKNVTVDVASGNGFFAYRSNGLRILDSHQVHARTQATEMAAVTDLILSGNVFDNGEAPPPDTASLSIDFGTAFFAIRGNRLVNCANICLQILGGVHDGQVLANEIGFVSDAGLGSTDGIVAYGVNSTKIARNTFTGGVGVSSTAVAVRNTTVYSSNINSCGNQLGPNLISGFAILYSPPSANDSCNTYKDSIVGADE